MALHRHVFSTLLLLISVTIIHPSCEAKHEANVGHLTGKALVEAVCRHTSDDQYCVDAIIPNPPLSAEEITSTALGWAQIRALEAGTIITSLLNETFILAPKPQQSQGILQRCWDLNVNAMSDLWVANGLFESKTLDGMNKYLYRAARDTRVCRDILKGSGYRRLLRKNNEIIKLSQISIVSTKFFNNPV